jgi:hypothetical protein
MSNGNQNPSIVRALELLLPGLSVARRLRRDIRTGAGQIASYLDSSGNSQAWTGDARAPYVLNVPQTPRPRVLNPALGASVPLLQCFEGPGRLFEFWATDLRDPTTNPPTLYLQIFDRKDAPVSGTTQPTVTAITTCASYEWTYDALVMDNGCWVGLSSTALVYTALAANQLFSLTARVLP